MFLLREVVVLDSPTWVHVPFSISDMSQIEEKLGSFSENPTRYRKEFLHLTQAYHLTWNDLYYILNTTLTPEEKERIWQAARTDADQLHNQHRTNPMADDAVPLTEPWWTYQASDAGIGYLHHIITCLLEGMLKSSHVHVNYDKIREVTQEKDENPALFLSELTEALQKYTNLDISTPARLLCLHVQFISQSAPDIYQKLCQLEKGPETPQLDLLEIAFKVFNNREEEAKRKKETKERPNMLSCCSYPRKEFNPSGLPTSAHPYRT